jgi:hypothetical protein
VGRGRFGFNDAREDSMDPENNAELSPGVDVPALPVTLESTTPVPRRDTESNGPGDPWWPTAPVEHDASANAVEAPSREPKRQRRWSWRRFGFLGVVTLLIVAVGLAFSYRSSSNDQRQRADRLSHSLTRQKARTAETQADLEGANSRLATANSNLNTANRNFATAKSASDELSQCVRGVVDFLQLLRTSLLTLNSGVLNQFDAAGLGRECGLALAHGALVPNAASSATNASLKTPR